MAKWFLSLCGFLVPKGLRAGDAACVERDGQQSPSPQASLEKNPLCRLSSLSWISSNTSFVLRIALKRELTSPATLLCLPGVAVILENTPRQGERKARLRRTSLWKQFCGQSSRLAHLNPGHSRWGHAPPVFSSLPLLHAQLLLMSPGSFSKIEEIIQAEAAVACTASKGSYMLRQEGAAINPALA